MKGDRALLWPNIINAPAINSMIIIGKSHHFFLTFKKFQNSTNSELLFDMIILLFLFI